MTKPAARVLELSPTLKLPVDAVTETFAILGKRGGGKTYTASVLVEEMLKAHLQVVVADPLGVWWGLRAAADGRGPGLGNVVILGGPHGDVPLEPAAGELVADLVVDEGLSVVLDLKELSKTQTRTFMTAFAERLYRRKRPEGEPVHLLLDEADTFVPQRYGAGDARMFGAFDDLVRKGRAAGIGVTLISQRSAKINKDVLSQCEVLIAVRTTHPRDRDAIGEWTEAHGTKDQVAQLLAGLASLPTGEAYVWSPSWLEVFERVRIRRRETYDSSSTPKVGEQRRPPKKLAQVDLEGLRQRMAASIERAQASTPPRCAAASPSSRRVCSSSRSRRPSWSRSPCSTTPTWPPSSSSPANCRRPPSSCSPPPARWPAPPRASPTGSASCATPHPAGNRQRRRRRWPPHLRGHRRGRR